MVPPCARVLDQSRKSAHIHLYVELQNMSSGVPLTWSQKPCILSCKTIQTVNDL